jgi:deoxyribonuclease-1
VPAFKFGIVTPYWVYPDEEPHPDCFTEKGKQLKNRDCAERNSKTFRKMQADMHNLVPAIGELNGIRSNYDFTEIPGEEREFGACDFEVITKQKIAEPPDQVRGDIGRIYLYMYSAYPDVQFLSTEEVARYQQWADADPVSKWECDRERRIAKIQGNRNHITQQACEKVGL